MTDNSNNNPNELPATGDGEARSERERPPVVVVMGHVDHGKTTLLDYIRKTNVASCEAGGITQAISAYEITHDGSSAGSGHGKRITFIDTPGHEAFTNMRSRGATAADIAILVVAAEEGIKPQTAEAIKILHDTKTPYVVAITKIDKPGANVEKVKTDLMTAGVLLEGYGGQVSYQPLSSKTGEGVSELLDHLLLVAEMEELKYDPKNCASGFILESRQNPKRGFEVSVILKNGTLWAGDAIATPSAKGKIRMLENFLGKQERELLPSAPALIVGFDSLPTVGEIFACGEEAGKLYKVPDVVIKPQVARTEEDVLNVIIKASDSGSLEAITQIIYGISENKPLRVIDESVGELTDGDVNLAVSTKSMIVAFKSKVARAATALAEVHKIKIVASQIIYEILQKIEEILEYRERGGIIAELEILALFNQLKMEKQLVGGRVLSGSLRLKHHFEINRAGQVVGQGRVLSVHAGKKEVNELPTGTEGGIIVNSPVAIAVGDKLVVKE